MGANIGIIFDAAKLLKWKKVSLWGDSDGSVPGGTWLGGWWTSSTPVWFVTLSPHLGFASWRSYCCIAVSRQSWCSCLVIMVFRGTLYRVHFFCAFYRAQVAYGSLYRGNHRHRLTGDQAEHLDLFCPPNPYVILPDDEIFLINRVLSLRYGDLSG